MFVSLVDFAVASIILVGMMIYYRITPGSALLFLPIVLIVQLIHCRRIAAAGDGQPVLPRHQYSSR